MQPKKLSIAVGLVTLMAALTTTGAAQPRPGIKGPQVGRAVRHDVSPPLSQMALPLPRAPAADREIPLLVPPPRPGRPDLPGVPDPLRQVEIRPLADAAATPQPGLSIEGLSDDDNGDILGFRIVPPDTEGDVGVNYYVQWINLIFAVYSKDGSDCADASAAPGCIAANGGPFAGNSIWSGFGGVCESTNDGDPIVLYDHLANRWLFSQFAIASGTQCVALSQGGDPRGPYLRWEFVVSPGQQNDYPKFGVMPDAYFLSLRDFPTNDGDFASAVAFNRAEMLGGLSNPQFVKFSLPCLRSNCPDGIQPPHLEGPPPPAGTPGVFSRAWDDDFDGPLTGTDGYRLWEFVTDWDNQSFSFAELPIVPASAGFDSTMCAFFQAPCIPQPPPGERLDPLDELQMYRAQFRHFDTHDTLLISTTVDATGGNLAGIRWAELRNPGSGWALFQEGTFAPQDGENRWMGSIAMDQAGNIALGYSVSSRNTFPSIRYTTRRAEDPAGTFPGGEVELIAGSDVQTASFQRWGDYSAMSVDPVDGCTFWYTQEYQALDDGRTDFDFKTRIGNFKIPGCGQAACAANRDSCDSDSDCCSNKCRGGTCRGQ
ncbi:MAG: hypothetical protein V3T83_14070 [Acidobacteriota bacterium]